MGEKMKRKLKRLSVCLLSVALVLPNFSIPAYASEMPENNTMTTGDKETRDYIELPTIPFDYKINYYLDGGENNPDNPTSYTKSTATIELKNPLKEGYIFEGWYSDSEFTTEVTSIPKGSSGTKNLYAKWRVDDGSISGVIDNEKGGIVWSIDVNGKLTVTGKGEVVNASAFAPWQEHGDKIKSAEINLSEVEDLEGFFLNCGQMTEVDLSNLDTSKVTNMYRMFSGCYNLRSLDLSTFDTSNVTSMNSMFLSCNSLETLDLSSFDTSKVTDMSNMFLGCSSLKSLDLSSFDFSGEYGSSTDVLKQCDSLVQIHTPKNLKSEVALPSAEEAGIEWQNSTTGEVYTSLPTNLNESIHLIKKDMVTNVSLHLDDSAYGSKIKMQFICGTKPNNDTYTYEFYYYYNDTKLDLGYPQGSASFSGTGGGSSTMTTRVASLFGGLVSGDVTIYAKAFKDGIEVATSNTITLKISDRRLKSVENIGVKNNILSWDAVEGAEAYYVTLYKKNGDNITTIYTPELYEMTETSVDLSNYSGVVRAYVQALSGDCASYLNSDYQSFDIPQEKIYTISYKLKGGKNNSANPSSYTQTTAKITLKDPKKTGYTFKGWYSDKKYTKQVKTIRKGSTGNKTLYAKWTANKYNIVFKRNGSTSGSMKKLSDRKYGKSYKLTQNAFKRTGYTFAGWNTKADGSGTSYADKASVKNLTSKDGRTVTLYAQWKIKNYKITYHLNGGINNSGNPKKYTVNTATVTLKKPTKEGYKFVGWYSDKKCTKKVTKIKEGSTGNKTLYAKWKKK